MKAGEYSNAGDRLKLVNRISQEVFDHEDEETRALILDQISETKEPEDTDDEGQVATMRSPEQYLLYVYFSPLDIYIYYFTLALLKSYQRLFHKY